VNVGIYFDHNAPGPVARELRRRGVDILLCYEDGTAELDDELLLTRTTELGRLLFTCDEDLLRITAQ
jgi:hypothetical protein